MQKGKQKKLNREFKEQEFQRLMLLREKLIYEFGNMKEEFLDLDPIERFINLSAELHVFSMFNDDKVKSLMIELEIGKGVTNYFVNAKSVFKSLKKLSKQSDFVWSYQIIWKYYISISRTFFLIQLAYELGFDLKSIGRGTKRQEKKGNLPEVFPELHEVLKEIKMGLEKENTNRKLHVFENSLIKSINKNISFSHKSDFYNLYHSLFTSNTLTNQSVKRVSDFKCEFYDLAEILLRDKSILTDDVDSQLNYGKEPGNCRFKRKRVVSLFLK